MAVYYKFKSAKDYDSIPIDGHFISVANLKERIFETKHLGRGTDFDLVVTNAQTNEEYLDEAMLIPKNTSVLIRRIPGRPRMPIVTQPDEPKVEKPDDDGPLKSNFTAADSSVLKDFETSEWDDEFGHDLYATIPEVTPVQSGSLILDAPPPSKADEDSKIKALIETPALDWQFQASDGFGPGRGFVRGARLMGGRGFGRVGLERKTPPPGYVCHRCKIPGHFIQHCPTNGDPNFDIKKVKPPTGIPKSMLMANPDGSYALPSGAAAVLKPNEAAFEKEIEGLPSTRSVGDLPPELHCPLCKEVMKDAVLTSKCCFKSFCDKCIRDYIISKSMCVCGARDILADDLLPNKTLRDTISRILESNNSSAENAGSVLQVQDMESARIQPKNPSPTQSAASKGEQMLPPHVEETLKPTETAIVERPVDPPQQPPLLQTSEKLKNAKIPDISEATRESVSVKEPVSQGSAPLAEQEVEQKWAAGDAGKKKRKKTRLPVNAAEMQWRTPHDFAAENYMTPMGLSAYNPYWPVMQPAMDAYIAPFPAPIPYNMGYGVGPMDPFVPVLPPDPFGAQGFMFPMVQPPRDLAELGMGFNARPPLMTREEFEARKADLKRKREIERCGEREISKDNDHLRESKAAVRGASQERNDQDLDRSRLRDDHHHHLEHRSSHRPESSRDSDFPRPSSKRKADHLHHDEDYDYDNRDRDRDRERDRHGHHHHQRSGAGAKTSSTASEPPAPPSKSTSVAAVAAGTEAADRKQKASVFSRISFPDEEQSKKRKAPSSSSAEPKPVIKDRETGGGSASGGHHRRTSAPSSGVRKNGYSEEYGKAKSTEDYESSDDDRHFKRKPSRYEPSPPKHLDEWEEEEVRHSRGSRERDRERLRRP
ncbi:hypothetical protein Nepgr_028493 [Nepenthes gracilis]|uniref:DWNN domain-containing protein n=1 Tax=Nepenthes gracilis TaxID=150966 RepID=A0AAD3TBT6_NEPGR|nr:hypothetical protein Nepgr_028493 [Nepenthes gracilis]